MGIASTYFHNPNDSEQQTLHRRIRLTEEQFVEQGERWNDLADHLVEKLNETSGRPISTWLQGSYKFGTQIRPINKFDEFDIDLGVYFEWRENSGDGTFSPVELKEQVQSALSDYEAEAIVELVSPPKSRCSRIRFHGNFHIDVPAYHLEPDNDTRMLATQDDKWENSDPKSLYDWFTGKFDNYKRDKVR